MSVIPPKSCADMLLERFKAVEDFEGRGDPRAACDPNKLKVTKSHGKRILVST